MLYYYKFDDISGKDVYFRLIWLEMNSFNTYLRLNIYVILGNFCIKCVLIEICVGVGNTKRLFNYTKKMGLNVGIKAFLDT